MLRFHDLLSLIFGEGGNACYLYSRRDGSVRGRLSSRESHAIFGGAGKASGWAEAVSGSRGGW